MQLRVSVDEFLRYCAMERQLSRNTLQAYEFDLNDFQNWLSTDTPASEIGPVELRNYLEHLVGVKKLSGATVRRRFACLRAFFRRVSELNDSQNPFVLWSPKLPRRKRLPRSLSRVEISRLMQGSENRIHSRMADPSLRLAVRLMVSTGVRVGELCKLRIEDVSLDGGSLRVLGKGSRDRVAYIADPTLQRELRTLVRDRSGSKCVCRGLLLNRSGSELKPQSIRTKLRQLAKDAGLTRRITPHMLRHTAATLLIEGGVDIRFVQRLLGHSTIATTEIYTHVTDEALRASLCRADILATLTQQ